MSKLSQINMRCTNLESLNHGVQQLGLELNEQSTFTWFSTSSQCDYAIRIPGATAGAWEIGVRREEDGTFSLHWDDWGGGGGMEKYVGKHANKLRQEYGLQEYMAAQREQGVTNFRRAVDEQGLPYVEALIE